jgi:CheY-like chemotaxis protein
MSSGNAPGATRILVVDDEADIAESLQFCLEQEGHDVRTASNGYEALGAIRAWQPHLVLLDVMLPGENGYRVCRTVKDDVDRGIQAPVRVVLVTARRLEDPERERTFAEFSRADRVIYKPFDLEEILSVVSELAADPSPAGAASR